MTREPVHAPRENGRSCVCGATFKTEAKLRRHLRDMGEEQDIWLNQIRPPRRREGS